MAEGKANMTLALASFHLGVAVVLGAVIGVERQWRQRMAGLRTNTLVALGAASFVVFSAFAPEDTSPTRVAAQVASGIGFLCAGVIFREGLSVRGLNTAATLWCSASVGVLAGGGALVPAAVVTALVVIVNLLLRPLVYRINQHQLAPVEQTTSYLVSIVCRSAQEAHVRALLLQGLATSGLQLRQLDSHDLADTDLVEVNAVTRAQAGADGALEQIVGRLSLESAVTAARWRSDPVEE
jgi:putative Mg2+ transporter-C (MgtC) family protein